MATLTWYGTPRRANGDRGATDLTETAYADLGKTSNVSLKGKINSIRATLGFSTNSYSKSYMVTAKLIYGSKSIESTQIIQLTSDNDSQAYFDFSFSTNGISASEFDSLSLLEVTTTTTDEKLIYLKGDQNIVVDYTPSNYIKYCAGSSWQNCIVHYYDGSKWIECVPYYYNGSNWIECNAI